MKEAFIKLHLSVLIAGGTGIFGRLITLNEGLLVWYRMLLAGVLFYIVLFLLKKLRKLPARDALRIASVGLLLAVHWLFFYGSIKASNVSIGVVCLSLMSFFTALFDPVINRHRVSASEILFSLVGVAGIGLSFTSTPVTVRVSLWESCRRHWLPCLLSATRKWLRVIRRALPCCMKWEEVLRD